MNLFLPVILLLVCVSVECRRGGGGSRGGGRGSSSRGSSGGFFSWGSSKPSGGTKPSTSTNTGSTGTNYGWKAPQTPSHTGSVATDTASTGTRYGWKAPSSGQSNRQPPPYSPHDPNKPRGPPPPYTPYDPKKYPSQNIGPNGYPVQQGSLPHYNTGSYFASAPPRYTQAANPASYGFTSNSYPKQNIGGYPGQGFYPGSHSASYGGLNMYGSGTHGFGYPSSNSWGYPGYAQKQSSTGSFLQGAAVGYVGSSLLHGHGGGYYSGPRFIVYRHRTQNNSNSNSTSSSSNKKEDNLITCLKYDVDKKETIFNENCTCTSTLTDRNTTLFNCTTSNGKETEIVEQAPPPLKYNNTDKYASEFSNYVEHIKTPEEVLNDDRNKIYRKLERLLDMGKFAPD